MVFAPVLSVINELVTLDLAQSVVNTKHRTNRSADNPAKHKVLLYQGTSSVFKQGKKLLRETETESTLQMYQNCKAMRHDDCVGSIYTINCTNYLPET